MSIPRSGENTETPATATTAPAEEAFVEIDLKATSTVPTTLSSRSSSTVVVDFAECADSTTTTTTKLPRSKQYLRDRCYGKSKYVDDEIEVVRKPPCYLCYVPNCVYWWSPVCEQNRFCEMSGRIGFYGGDDDHHELRRRRRRKVFAIGLIVNVAALFLTLFACFSITANDANVLSASSFSKGVASVRGTADEVYVDIGLRAVAVTDKVGALQPQVMNFTEFCFRYEDTFGNNETTFDECDACEKESRKLVTSVIFSLLLVFPSITTDVLRMYSNYDVNCQKFYGSFVSTLSMLVSLYTLLLYNNKCFTSFQSGTTPFEIQNPSYLSPSAALGPLGHDNVIEVDLSWGAGNALLCMYVATSLKIVDIVCHLIVPTPAITRDRNEQDEYERLFGNTAAESKDGDIENDAEANTTDDRDKDIEVGYNRTT